MRLLSVALAVGSLTPATGVSADPNRVDAGTDEGALYAVEASL